MPTRKAVSILVVSNTLVMLTKLVIYHFNPAVGSRGQRGQRRARAIFSAHSATRARTFERAALADSSRSESAAESREISSFNYNKS